MQYLTLTMKEWTICETQLKNKLTQIKQTGLLNRQDRKDFEKSVMQQALVENIDEINPHTSEVEISVEGLGKLLTDTQTFLQVLLNLKHLKDVINNPAIYKLILPESVDLFKKNLVNTIQSAVEVINLMSKTFHTKKTKRELEVLNYAFVTLASYAEDPTDLAKLLIMRKSIDALDALKQSRPLEVLNGCLKGVAAISLSLAAATTSLSIFIITLGSTEGMKFAGTQIMPHAEDYGKRAIYDLYSNKSETITRLQTRGRLFETPQAKAPEIKAPVVVSPPPTPDKKTAINKKKPRAALPIKRSSTTFLKPVAVKSTLKSNKVAPLPPPPKKNRR